MKRKDALAELIAKVEAGGLVQPFLFQDALNNQDTHKNCAGEAYSAYEGSLDAAKALHDAVLPGWSWTMDQTGKDMKAHCQVWWFHGGKRSKSYVGHTLANLCPARAWLLAILCALHAQ